MAIEKPSCNLVNHSCNPVIPKGHFKCWACCGTGIMVRSFHYKGKYVDCYYCPICFGAGYVDWITFIKRQSEKRAFVRMVTGFTGPKYHVIQLPLKCPTNEKCKVMRNIEKRFNNFLKHHSRKEMLKT